MIDPKRIEQHFEQLDQQLARRGNYHDQLVAIKTHYQQWKKKLKQFETLKQTQKQTTPEQRTALTTLASQIKAAKEQVDAAKKTLDHQLLQLPNSPAHDVPSGQSAADNPVLRYGAEPKPTPSFKPQSHDQLAAKLQLVDVTHTTRMTGTRFVTYKGQGAQLKRALIQFMLDYHRQTFGYYELAPPLLINTKSLTGTGQLPKFEADQFKCQDTDYWLSPTAEVQLTNYYQDTIIPDTTLPIKLMAYTPCFRKEAGSYGHDTKGLIRLHQFDKVELVQLVHPDHGTQALETLLSNACAILDQLKLPYRVVTLCTGDLGFSAAKTYDIEVWFPAQNTYREISSCSLFMDFQARRSMIRYKCSKTKQTHFVYTLNGSGLAIDRTIAALLEHYQTEAGTLTIPDCLSRYFPDKTIAL